MSAHDLPPITEPRGITGIRAPACPECSCKNEELADHHEWNERIKCTQCDSVYRVMSKVTIFYTQTELV